MDHHTSNFRHIKFQITHSLVQNVHIFIIYSLYKLIVSKLTNNQRPKSAR